MHTTVGHKHILNFFDKVREQGSLSHAYCFTGPQHVGKRTVAQYLASSILGIPQEKLYTSMDYTFVGREINEKTGKLRKDISIDQIRKLISHLASKSFYKDGYKIAVVDHAELLSISASNALLKTLEEPKEKMIIFLITPDENALLSTIQSRCQMIHFSLVPDTMLHEYSEKNNVDEKRQLQMIQHAYGMPGKMISWITDPESFQTYLTEYARFENLIGKNFYEKLQAVEELFGDKTDHIAAREHLQDILNMWRIGLHQKIFDNDVSHISIIHVEKRIKNAQEMLAKNIHPRLLVEQILLEL